jgi:hypothetical protein
MKQTQSAYSKMYLVTPTVYEKLLHCLDKSDAKMTSDLNVEKEDSIQRPAEKEIESLNLDALNQPAENPPEIPVTYAETVQVPQEMQIEDVPPPQQQQQQQQQTEGLLDEDEMPPPQQYEIVNNPLKQSCSEQSEDTSTVVPRDNFIYNPNWKQVPKIKVFTAKRPQPVRATPISYHPYGPPGERNIDKTKKFQCNICAKFFDRKWALTR